MQKKRIYNFYWSATGNTKKITGAVSAGITAAIKSNITNRSINDSPYGFNDTKVTEINFTKPAARETTYRFTENDLVIIGAPTYAGKLPNKILPDFQTKLLGYNTPAIAIVTYGNRSYDNSLAELTATLKNNGFRVIAAAAFPCRHAFSDKLAGGRPNQDDLQKASAFGQQALERILAARWENNLYGIKAGGNPISFPQVIVPGDAGAAYYVPKGRDGLPAKFLKAKPKTDVDKCSRCGKCIEVCPMNSVGKLIDTENMANNPCTAEKADTTITGSQSKTSEKTGPAITGPQHNASAYIHSDNKKIIDFSAITGICIKCQACIRSCPEGAKYFDDPAFLSHVAMLEENYTAPKEAEFFLC